MTTASNGFEAYFDTDMVLVIAVCFKKERLTLKVTDCNVADGRWVCAVTLHLQYAVVYVHRSDYIQTFQVYLLF